MTRVTRRWPALVAALSLVLTIGSPVAANPPQRTDGSQLQIFCADPLVADQGVAILGFAEAGIFGPFADLFWWAGLGEPEGAPTAFATSATGSVADLTLTMSFGLEDEAGGSHGSAELVATFGPNGPLTPFSMRQRLNNTWFVNEGVEQDLIVTAGTLTIGDAVLDLTGCAGFLHTEHSFQTSPNANVFDGGFVDVSCQLELGEQVVFFNAFVFDSGEDASGGFVNMSVEPDGLGGGADTPFLGSTPDGWSAESSIELFSFETGEFETAAELQLTLTPTGEVISQSLPRRAGWEKSTFYVYSVAGSIVSDGLGIGITDLSTCSAVGEHVRAVTTNQRGPSGRTPVNDKPGNAIAIESGFSTAIKTGGASDGEAPASCIGDVPFARTVWYKLEGADAEVTIDTAGSDFDTVVAVYVKEDLGSGPEFVEIACVDDVFLDFGRTIQASLTGFAEAGTTYWIQVGGWNNEWGRLVLSVE